MFHSCTRTIDNRTHTFFVDTDDAGDYAMYLIVGGEWAHLWRYDVTVEAEYTSSVAVTLHWSSADGVDLMEPVVVEADPGMRLGDALTAAGKPYDDLFSKDGYEDYGYRSLHPVDSYADDDAFYDDCIASDYLVNDDTDIYVVMFKELDAVEISIGAPACGSTDAPAVSIATSECSADREPIWIKDINTPRTHGLHESVPLGDTRWERCQRVRKAAKKNTPEVRHIRKSCKPHVVTYINIYGCMILYAT